MTIRLTRRARDDLAKIITSVGQHDSEAANRVRNAIASALRLIDTRPNLGIRHAKMSDLRSRLVSGYPYRIHYTVKDTEIRIIHIRHSARRPWTPEATRK